ncbi:hypothetical protein HDU76_011710, partial [Blyttiomyces sp. JEL0837]
SVSMLIRVRERGKTAQQQDISNMPACCWFAQKKAMTRYCPRAVPEPIDFALFSPNAPLVTKDPVTIYYIFYGNFTDLEISRIINYPKHISDPSTVPKRWSVATKYYDVQGNFVNKEVKFGGSVHDKDYSYGYNLSTTHSSYFNLNGIPIEQSDLGKIILEHVGNGKTFPYDSHAIYSVVSPPDVHVQECPMYYCYGGYQFSWKATIDDEERVINHAFVPAIMGFSSVAGDLDTAPNGDTGRYVVDFVVQAIHHEASRPDPFVNIAWQDQNTKSLQIENGDACEYDQFILRNLRFTKSSLNATGRYYNTIINNQIYAIQDIWGFDDQGIQSCYSSTVRTRNNEFKAVSAAVNPVTATDGIKNYNGPVNVPCKGFYNSKSYGGYHTLGGEDACHFIYQGPSILRTLEAHQIIVVNATFDLPIMLASKVNEANAVMTFHDDVNPPTVTDDGKVLVVYQDDWKLVPDANGITRQVDFGVSYWCRALVDGIWYVGATNKFKDSCEMNINRVYTAVLTTDASVSLLVKPAPK